MDTFLTILNKQSFSQAREEMLKRFANDKSVQVSLSSTDISTLGCETVGFSAADMTNLLQDAAMMPMQRFTYEECATITAEEVYILKNHMYQACN